MFELAIKDIHLNEQAHDKKDAITHIAKALVSAGYVDEGYVDGMLQREQQSATYLGNGIAIPHGTTTTRHLVKKTGVQIFHFPAGVAWGDESELAYIAIGIAASSDEHLTLLRQLTRVLSEDGVEERIKQIQSAEEIIAILTGKPTLDTNELHIDCSLLDIPADSLQTLQALNASRLHKIAAVNSQFIAHVIEQQPAYLGQGIWLSDSEQGNLNNAIAISRPADIITEQEQPVKLLITASAVNDVINNAIEKLAAALFNRHVDTLLSGNAEALTTFFNTSLISSEAAAQTKETSQESSTNAEGISREFVVINPHGLHTRPSSTLVKLIKSFNSTITIANLDGTAKPVSATSLMKIVALGAKKGSRLLFTAVGDDAAQALDAIGKAMAEGLGEGTE